MGFECYTLYLLHIQHGGEEGEQGDRIKGSRVEVMLREYKLVLQEFCFSFFFFFFHSYVDFGLNIPVTHLFAVFRYLSE